MILISLLYRLSFKFSELAVSHFEEIKMKLASQPRERRGLITNAMRLTKLVLVSAATSTTPERSFYLARRLKTLIRSSMLQKRFNSLALLSFNKELCDKISLIEVANEFVDSKPNRKNIFGKFDKNDL